MNVAGLFLLGLVLLALQTTAFRFLGVSSLRSPLVLPVVLFAAFRLEPTRGLILAFLLGYASDLFGGGAKGIGPLVMILLCLLGHWMRRGLLLKGPWGLGFMAGPFGFFHGVLFMGIGALVEGSLWLEDFQPAQLLIQAGLLWALGPALVWICGLTDGLMKKGFGRKRRVKT